MRPGAVGGGFWSGEPPGAGRQSGDVEGQYREDYERFPVRPGGLPAPAKNVGLGKEQEEIPMNKG